MIDEDFAAEIESWELLFKKEKKDSRGSFKIDIPSTRELLQMFHSEEMFMKQPPLLLAPRR
jgi:hypothetical protein